MAAPAATMNGHGAMWAGITGRAPTEAGGTTPVAVGRPVGVTVRSAVLARRLLRRRWGGLPSGSEAGGHEPDGDDEDDDAGPVVEAQPAEGVGEVDAQGLDPEPAEGVGGHVHGEEVAPAKPEVSLGEQHDTDHGQVPQALIQKRGLERGEPGVAGGAVGQVDTYRPRQPAGPAE